VTVKVSGLTGVAVPAGKRTVVYNNATDVGDQISYLSSLTLGSALPTSSGGTGSTSTTFVNLASNVTGTLPATNGGTGQSSFAVGDIFYANTTTTLAKLNIGSTNQVLTVTGGVPVWASPATPGTGTVTSVTGTGSANGLTLSGTVTSSGNITLGGSVTSLTTTNFTIQESGGKLIVKYGATTILSISSTGALIAANNITAYGTP
jgi:hypothetical protein